MIDTEHNLPSPQTQDDADQANPPPNVPALQKRLSEILEEYETKFSNIDAEVAVFEQAGGRLKSAACVSGTWGDSRIDTGSVHASRIKESLMKSAWLNIYNGLSIETIAPVGDKNKFKQAKPAASRREGDGAAAIGNEGTRSQ